MTKNSLQSMAHEEDPKEKLLKSLGDISGIEVLGTNILVATYIRPEKTKGGIIIHEKLQREDQYQGKVGLIVAIGPDAFKNDPDVKCSTPCQIGDWVTYRHSDGTACWLKGTAPNESVHCRLMPWEYLMQRVDHPDRIM